MQTIISAGRPDPVLIRGIGFAMPANAFIADQLPCRVPVKAGQYAGNVNTYPLALYFGDAGLSTENGGMKRNAGSEYASAYDGHRQIQTAYNTVERALMTVIDDQLIENAGEYGTQLRAQKIMPQWLTIKLEKERTVTSAVFSTASYPDTAIGALTGGAGTVWTSDISNPVKDGLAAREVIRTASGVYPDYAVISHDVAVQLSFHPQILGIRVIGDIADGPTSQKVDQHVVSFDALRRILAQLWQLPNGVYITEAMYNSAMPGQTVSLAEISAGKVAFHCSRGINGAFQMPNNDLELGQGPASLIIPVQSDFQLLSDRCINPHGEQHVIKHSFGTCVPSNMTDTALILTGVIG